MAIWQTIKDDHDKVEGLFEKIDECEESDERTQLIAQLKTELEAHSMGEEKVVYPELAKIDELKDKIAHSREEHDTVAKLMRRIVKADEDEQTTLLTELEEAVQDHVAEEEDEIIPVGEKEIDEKTAKDMLRRFEAVKKEAARSS
jgi:hemerythrin superfamily protein